MCNFLFGSKIDRNLWLEKSIEMSNKLSQSQTLKWILIYIYVYLCILFIHLIPNRFYLQLFVFSISSLMLFFYSIWMQRDELLLKQMSREVFVDSNPILHVNIIFKLYQLDSWWMEVKRKILINPNPFKLDSNSKWSLMLCLKRKRDVEKCFLMFRINFSYHSLALVGILFLRETIINKWSCKYCISLNLKAHHIFMFFI